MVKSASLGTMIHFSSAALSEVHRLKAQHPNPQAVFRLRVQPGGCSDYYYFLQFDEAPQPDDWVKSYLGIQVVIDPESLGYVEGLSLDYSEDLMGGAFRFDNPKAAQHCGCGNSFSIANTASLQHS